MLHQRDRYSVYLLYYYKGTNTDAAAGTPARSTMIRTSVETTGILILLLMLPCSPVEEAYPLGEAGRCSTYLLY